MTPTSCARGAPSVTSVHGRLPLRHLDASRAAISLDRVVKKYGQFRALDGCTMQVKRGEIYGLIGPNGAGKTTAIRVLTGLARANGGQAWTLGRPAPPSDAVLREIGYMPQEIALYGDLTIQENLDTLRRIYGIPMARFHDWATRLLRLVALEDRRDSIVHDLSGGMKRRVSLVAAIVHGPALLILDEPTVGVDPELRADFWAFFRSLGANGVTILMTTHYMDEARNCDRVGLMHRGRLIADGAPRNLMEATSTDSLETAFVELAKG